MVTEKELDELYDEVKEDRNMFESEIDYEHIRGTIADILLAFKMIDSNGKKVKYLIITLNGNRDGKWEWRESTLTKKFRKLNAGEKQYFEKILKKYCESRRLSETKWEIKFKKNN